MQGRIADRILGKKTFKSNTASAKGSLELLRLSFAVERYSVFLDNNLSPFRNDVTKDVFAAIYFAFLSVGGLCSIPCE